MKIERPVTPSHLKNNKKAELNKQEELEEIQRKNRILYEKMAYMKFSNRILLIKCRSIPPRKPVESAFSRHIKPKESHARIGTHRS